MRKILFGLLGVALVSSCNLQGVQTDSDGSDDIESDTLSVSTNEDQPVKKSEPEVASDTLVLDNGMMISYFKKGDGEAIKKGDVVKIAYREKLEDGTVFDGNHIVKKEYIPFLVGWNLQTKGWDLALENLKVGDDVDVFIPSKLGRGEKGIKNIIPPNSNTILSLRVIEKFAPTDVVEGVQIWRYDEIEEARNKIEEGDEVYMNYFVSSESNPRYDNNYQRGTVYKLVIGDVSVMPGLELALKTAKEGDRILVKIPSKMAYGSKGLIGLVKPNEDLFYDIQVAQVIKKKVEESKEEDNS